MAYEIDRQVATTLADEQPSLREMCVCPSFPLCSRSKDSGFDASELAWAPQVHADRPTRARRTMQALKHLAERGSRGKGFFLMVEGSRIDMAGYTCCLSLLFTLH